MNHGGNYVNWVAGFSSRFLMSPALPQMANSLVVEITRILERHLGREPECG
jgi:hypothetical protein